MRRLQALLVGLGQIGCGYDLGLPFHIDQPFSGPATLSHARALVCNPHVQLLAAIDPLAAARERFSRCYNLPAYSDIDQWHQAMPDAHVDLVVLAVPAALQPSLVEALLQRLTPKLLLLEKPVAVSLAEAQRVRRACARQPQLKVAVNYIRRYLPAVLNVQQKLKTGALGHLLHGQVIYGKGLLSNGSHFVNLAEAWLGPLEAHSCLDPGVDWAGFDSEASVMLRASRHQDAPLGVRSIGAAGLRAGELDLWFSRGRLRWENDGRSVAIWPLAAATSGDSYRPLVAEPERLPTEIEHYQYFVLDSLVKCLLATIPSPLHCTLDEGFHTLEILEQARDAGD